MKKLDPRVQVFIYVGVALLALLMLAGSLNNLVLSPGTPMPLRNMAPELYDPAMPDGFMRTLLAIFRAMLIIGWVVLPFYIIYLIINKEARKRFLRDLLMFLPIALMFYWLSTTNIAERAAEELNLEGMSAEQMELTELAPIAPLPEFNAPPSWVTTATAIFLAVALTLIIIAIAAALWRRTHQSRNEPLRRVEREAKAAIDAIEAGGDIRGVIIRCYLQMVQAVSEYRNLQRGADMTPHEFEAFLLNRGMPAGPVHQLTQLFEQVRYGASNPGRQDERAAIASLSAIVSACQRMRA